MIGKEVDKKLLVDNDNMDSKRISQSKTESVTNMNTKLIHWSEAEGCENITVLCKICLCEAMMRCFTRQKAQTVDDGDSYIEACLY